MSKHIIVDVDKCVGCHTCELACAMAHSESGDLELMVFKGERPRYRLRVETTGSKPTVVTCQHGEDAECIEACEFEAIQSDISDEVPDLSGVRRGQTAFSGQTGAGRQRGVYRLQEVRKGVSLRYDRDPAR